MILGEIGWNDATAYTMIAAVSSILFVIQLVLMAIGAGHHDTSGFNSGDATDTVAGHEGAAATFQLFSVQSVLAFLMGFGWTGLGGLNEWNLSRGVTVLLSFVVGLGFLVLSAFLNSQIRRLNSEPKYNIKDCIGKTGTVYVSIPESKEGMGQVTVTVSGRKRTLQARSTGGPIAAFATVKIVAVDDDEHVTVEPA